MPAVNRIKLLCEIQRENCSEGQTLGRSFSTFSEQPVHYAGPIIQPSIHFLNPLSAQPRVTQSAGASPSYHWLKPGLHPG